MRHDNNNNNDSDSDSDIYDPSIAMFDVRFEGNSIGSALFRGKAAFYKQFDLSNSELLTV